MFCGQFNGGEGPIDQTLGDYDGDGDTYQTESVSQMGIRMGVITPNRQTIKVG